MLLDCGHTATAATGMTVTVIAALPPVPSLVAVIVDEPGATPVTNPVLETVATLGLLLAHVTGRPVSGVPAASFSVAVSCIVFPTGSSPDAGDTSTEATTDEVGPAVSTARQLITAYAAAIKAAERRRKKRNRFTPGQGRTATSRDRATTFYAVSSTEFPT